MACCGEVRTQFYAGARIDPAPGAHAPIQPRIGMPAAPIRFEYVGSTGLSVRGPITGRTYRFNGPGEQVAVDPRDAPSLMAVPKLRTARA
jgi:hypothetical protein